MRNLTRIFIGCWDWRALTKYFAWFGYFWQKRIIIFLQSFFFWLNSCAFLSFFWLSLLMRFLNFSVKITDLFYFGFFSLELALYLSAFPLSQMSGLSNFLWNNFFLPQNELLFAEVHLFCRLVQHFQKSTCWHALESPSNSSSLFTPK